MVPKLVVAGSILAGLTLMPTPAQAATTTSLGLTPRTPASIQRVVTLPSTRTSWVRRTNTRLLPSRLPKPRPIASPAPKPTPVPVATTPPVTAVRTTPVELNVTPGLYDTAGLNRVLDLAVKGGATSIYSVANWSALAPDAPRAYDWSALDRLTAAAQTRNLGLRFQLTSTPDWVHPELVSQGMGSNARKQTPPLGAEQLAQWKTFVSDLASRYGTKVQRYEMWNEQNDVHFWTPGPNPAQYVPLLKAGYEAVKAVAPSSQVLFGGLSRNDAGYLTEFYRVANATPGVPANHWFDTLDVHPYSGDRAPSVNLESKVWNAPWGVMDENFLGLTRMKAVMTAHGEPDKHIFIGEYGFRTTGTEWSAPVPDATRAGYLTEAYRLAGTLPYVDGMNWYSLMATAWDDPAWTLVSESGVESATFAALVALKNA